MGYRSAGSSRIRENEHPYGSSRYLLFGPGTVPSGRAGPSGATVVGCHRRSLSIPWLQPWGVSTQGAFVANSPLRSHCAYCGPHVEATAFAIALSAPQYTYEDTHEE
jgi:hypothetical protein